MYCIAKEYITNKSIPMMQTAKQSEEYQTEVYAYVADVIKHKKLYSVLDIGCGKGKKLKKYILPLTSDITGIDRKEVVEAIGHNFGTWLPKNITTGTDIITKKFDIIIVSDVIEHFEKPEYLLDYIKKQANDSTYIVFSTPDRKSLGNESGPPKNIKHVREWLYAEFIKYLNISGFRIIESFQVLNKHNYNTIICMCVKCPV